MLRLIFPLLALLCLATTARAEEPLVVEETFLSVTIGGQPFRLQALVAKEAGQAGRLPVAIITHGQNAQAERRERLQPRQYLRVARDFARRGWLAVVVLRRGFGLSGGEKPFLLAGCRNGDYGAPVEAQADDLDAALEAIARRADADVSQVVAIGESLGGAAVLAWGARSPEGLRAAVNVSGGVRTTEREGGPPVTCKAEDLISFFARLGEKSRIPTLWLYAENDSLFQPDYVRRLHEAYVAKGGRTDFHMFEPIGKDGHGLYAHADGMLRWIPVLDRFLREHHLRTFDQGPIDAAVAALKPNAALRHLAARYHGRPTEKVMAISASNSRAMVQFGGTALPELERKAIEECEKAAKETCRILMRNFEVVTPAAPTPAEPKAPEEAGSPRG